MVEEWKCGAVWNSMVEQWSIVEQCGGTVLNSIVEQCGNRLVEQGTVERYGETVEQYNGTVEQCGTVWNSVVETGQINVGR